MPDLKLKLIEPDEGITTGFSAEGGVWFNLSFRAANSCFSYLGGSAWCDLLDTGLMGRERCPVIPRVVSHVLTCLGY